MTISAIDSAIAALRRFIAHSEFPPGARIPAERDLAESLGTSRPTVREAIRQLVEAGVLESRRGSGTYVCTFDYDEVFAVRLQLEPFAARLAAEHADESNAIEMMALLLQLEHRQYDAGAFADADQAIHAAIARIGGNRLLLMTLQRLTDLMEVSRAVTATSLRIRTTALQDMRTLIDAIRRGDGPDADRAMRRHLEHVRRGGIDNETTQLRAITPTPPLRKERHA